jgi:hypothetical protein
MGKFGWLMAAGLVLVVLAPTARADWNVGDPYKMQYPQLPDLTNGMDVLDGPTAKYGTLRNVYLADDFMCTQSGPITGIHIWNSYVDDTHFAGEAQFYNLAIYSDVPATGPNGHSMPGTLLWSTYVTATHERVWAQNLFEGFLDPTSTQSPGLGVDATVWQTNFNIPVAQAFVQQVGQVYWLAVNRSADVNGDGVVDDNDIAILYDTNWASGWKSSADAFNDDAVWIPVSVMNPTGPQFNPSDGSVWHELVAPQTGASMNLSFVITPEPATLSLLALGGLAALRRRTRR